MKESYFTKGRRILGFPSRPCSRTVGESFGVIMEHIKRLVLIPEHMTGKKPLVPPLTAQVNHLNSEMDDVLQRQDMTQDEKAKLYDQTLQRYLTYYDK